MGNSAILSLCVVELTGSSHNSKKREVRDKLLRAACEPASLSFVEIPAKLPIPLNRFVFCSLFYILFKNI